MKAFSDKKRNGFLNWDYLKSEKKENRELSDVPHSVFCKLTRTPTFQKVGHTFNSFSIFFYQRGEWISLLFAGHKMDGITHNH